MANHALNALVEAVGHVSANSSTMTGAEEALRDVGWNEYGDAWEAAVEAWEAAHPNFNPTEEATGSQFEHAYNMHFCTGNTQAARDIWAAGRDFFGAEKWRNYCLRLH